MKKKLLITSLTTLVALTPLASVSHAEEITVAKEMTQETNQDKSLDEQDLPVVDVVYEKTVTYKENGEIQSIVVNGVAVNPMLKEVINEGSGFTWTYVGTRDSTNKAAQTTVSVATILIGALSPFFKSATMQSSAIGVSGSLGLFGIPETTYYTTLSYKDTDSIYDYMKNVTTTYKDSGRKTPVQTKEILMKYYNEK